MIEVETSERIYVSLLADDGSSSGECWGDDSEIWLEVDNGGGEETPNTATDDCVMFFHNGAAYSPGTKIPKGEFAGSFIIKALSASEEWNDIKIAVKGIPKAACPANCSYHQCEGHEHACCGAAVSFTNYRIGVEIMERPLICTCDEFDDESEGSSSGSHGSASGSYSESSEYSCSCSSYGSWGEPEEQGEHLVIDDDGNDIMRRWYVLKAENENAIRAVVEPQCLADIVEKTTFHSSQGTLPTRDFLPNEEAPSTPVQPPWYKFLYDGGTYYGTTATIYVTVESEGDSGYYGLVGSYSESGSYSEPVPVPAPIAGKVAADVVQDQWQWRVTRNGGAKATAEPLSDTCTIAGLAAKIGLKALSINNGQEVQEFKKWLTLPLFSFNVCRYGKLMRISPGDLRVTDEILRGTQFEIPNTMLAFWRGDLKPIGQTHVGWQKDIENLRSLGFKVDEKDEKGFKTGKQFRDYLSDKTKPGTEELHGVILWSHGFPEGLASRHVTMNVYHSEVTGSIINGVQSSGALNYKLGFVILNACYTDFKRGDTGTIRKKWPAPWPTEPYGPLAAGGRDWASGEGSYIFRGHPKVLVPLLAAWITTPNGIEPSYHTVKNVFQRLPKGWQGTKANVKWK